MRRYNISFRRSSRAPDFSGLAASAAHGLGVGRFAGERISRAKGGRLGMPLAVSLAMHAVLATFALLSVTPTPLPLPAAPGMDVIFERAPLAPAAAAQATSRAVTASPPSGAPAPVLSTPATPVAAPPEQPAAPSQPPSPESKAQSQPPGPQTAMPGGALADVPPPTPLRLDEPSRPPVATPAALAPAIQPLSSITPPPAVPPAPQQSPEGVAPVPTASPHDAAIPMPALPTAAPAVVAPDPPPLLPVPERPTDHQVAPVVAAAPPALPAPPPRQAPTEAKRGLRPPARATPKPATGQQRPAAADGALSHAADGPAAPAPAAATASPAAAAASGPAQPVVSADWTRALTSWLVDHKTYPAAARRRAEEGQALVRFTVDRDGRVLDFALVRGTGSSILDAAVETLLRGAKLPAFPADMPQPQTVVSVTIRYALEP